MDDERSDASASNLTPGDYQISADALSNGTYISSPTVNVNVPNSTPVAESFSPVSSTKALGRSYQTNSVYSDQNGVPDITECLVRIRQGSVSTQAIYNRPDNLLYLLQDNGQRSVGFAPGTANVISNSLVALNCAETSIFTSNANKQVQVRWNFISKTPLLGVNDIDMDVYDVAGAHPNFIKKATWEVYGEPNSNATPIPVQFSPLNGSSRVDRLYETNVTYFDDNGYTDLENLVVGFRQGTPGAPGFFETRAYYNRPTNKLYILNDQQDNYVGGEVAGDPNSPPISNSLVTIDCATTTTFVSAAKKQVQVRWKFIPRAGLVGTNDVYMEAFDASGARSGFLKRATWTVTNPSSATTSATMSSSDTSSDPSGAAASKSSAPTYTDENPYVGEMPSSGPRKSGPITTKGDGTKGPPLDDGEPKPKSASGASASSSLEKPPSPSSEQS